MSDLIDRQQALEIKFSNAIVRRCAVYVRMDELVNKLNALPSVQPERTEERTEMHACDCISRQAAIRWVKTECNPYGKPTLEFESGKKVIEHLGQMPAAQPELKTGKWMLGFDNRYMEKYYYCSRCGGRKYGEHEPLDYFCSNCGAKMKGASE